MSPPRAIGIAGTGRVARALGRLLAEAGEPVAAVAGRNAEHASEAASFIGAGARAVRFENLPASADRILIAVSDAAIPDVALALARAGIRSGTALHTCGARGPEALAPLQAAGVACGVLHPLQTIATPEQGLAALRGCRFGVTGDPPAVAWAEAICNLLGSYPLRLAPDSLPVYHAAAVMASNAVTAVIDAAVLLIEQAGVERHDALQALTPLAEAAVHNALTLGPEAALTGPVRRGDLETIRRHLDALSEAPPAVRNLYRAAALALSDLAVRSGLDPSRARAIEALLRERQ